MVFDLRLFKRVTTRCFFAVTLIVLGNLNELKCNEHALDFQKNSKILEWIPTNEFDFNWINLFIDNRNLQFQFVSFGRLKGKMSIYHAILPQQFQAIIRN